MSNLMSKGELFNKLATVQTLGEAYGIIQEMPTVDAVPVVTGTWKAVTDDGENYKRICTCCGKEAPFDELEGVYLIYPHCPWCGADMRKDGDHEQTKKPE